MTGLHASLLANFPLIRATDPAEAAERWKIGFGATSAQVHSEPHRVLLIVNNLQLTDLGLAYVATSGPVEAEFPPKTFVRQLFNIEGRGSLSFADQTEEIHSGAASMVVPAGVTCGVAFGGNYKQLVLRIELNALYRYLGALIGRDADRELVFARSVAGNPAMLALKARVLQFASDYNARGAHFAPLAQVEIQRMLIMKFLLCHRHSYTELLLRDPIPSSPSSVRLSEEYLEANWNSPIDVVALARIAGVSARSLFRAFRKERGQSPAEYLKELRLRRALVMLENPETNTTVTQVALMCGFLNGGHFARDYQTKFGELPSATLSRARKAQRSAEPQDAQKQSLERQSEQ